MPKVMRVWGDAPKWHVLLGQLSEAMDKVGLKDFILPKWAESDTSGRVVVNVTDKGGNWKPLSSSGQGSPEKNLVALIRGIDHARLAEAWGVGLTVIDALQLKALASGHSPYRTLGVDEGEKDMVKLLAAYRRRCKETHPDTGGETADPKEFKDVQAAAEQLGVVDK